MVAISPTIQIAPPARHRGDITIADIEARVGQLKAGWEHETTLREVATLFAILKVGSNIQKLVWFTNYERTFLYGLTADLRSRHRLLTGTLSPQFVLHRCPGAEDLIEAITGVRPYIETAHQAAFAPPSTIPTKGVRMNMDRANGTGGGTATAAAAQAFPAAVSQNATGEQRCARTATCSKNPGHVGLCSGTNGRTGKSREPRKAKPISPPAAEAIVAAPHARVSRSAKSIEIGGGTVTLAVEDVNVLDLSEKERTFLFGLIDQFRAQGKQAT